MQATTTANTWHRMIGALVLTLGISACGADEPKSVGLTGIVYNYSDETIAFVRINGKEVGRGLDEAKPGEVKGGAYICCFKLPMNSQIASVGVTLWDGKAYETTATIEKWWPDLAHYGVVHILPGRKVVMEIRSVETWPRKDLLDAQLKALNIPSEYDYTGPMNVGPLQRTDGVQ